MDKPMVICLLLGSMVFFNLCDVANFSDQRYFVPKFLKRGYDQGLRYGSKNLRFDEIPRFLRNDTFNQVSSDRNELQESRYDSLEQKNILPNVKEHQEYRHREKIEGDNLHNHEISGIDERNDEKLQGDKRLNAEDNRNVGFNDKERLNGEIKNDDDAFARENINNYVLGGLYSNNSELYLIRGVNGSENNSYDRIGRSNSKINSLRQSSTENGRLTGSYSLNYRLRENNLQAGKLVENNGETALIVSEMNGGDLFSSINQGKRGSNGELGVFHGSTRWKNRVSQYQVGVGKLVENNGDTALIVSQKNSRDLFGSINQGKKGSNEELGVFYGNTGWNNRVSQYQVGVGKHVENNGETALIVSDKNNGDLFGSINQDKRGINEELGVFHGSTGWNSRVSKYQVGVIYASIDTIDRLGDRNEEIVELNGSNGLNGSISDNQELSGRNSLDIGSSGKIIVGVDQNESNNVNDRGYNGVTELPETSKWNDSSKSDNSGFDVGFNESVIDKFNVEYNEGKSIFNPGKSRLISDNLDLFEYMANWLHRRDLGKGKSNMSAHNHTLRGTNMGYYRNVNGSENFHNHTLDLIGLGESKMKGNTSIWDEIIAEKDGLQGSNESNEDSDESDDSNDDSDESEDLNGDTEENEDYKGDLERNEDEAKAPDRKQDMWIRVTQK